jgi:hypothetical protein
MKGMSHLGCQGFDPGVVIKDVGLFKRRTKFAPLWGQKGGPNPMNIFGKKDNGQVRVPEIEVRGDEVRVQETDDGQDQEQKPQDRSYRLPKTKWF